MVQSAPSRNRKTNRPDGAQSIHRAMSIIRVVAKHNAKGISLSKIARTLVLPSSTTHRMLTVLCDEGMLCYNSMSKLYNLGFGLYLLGSGARQYQLRDAYRSILEKTAHQTGDTAFLVIKSAYDVLCIDRVVGSTPIQVLSMDVGARRPLGVGAGSLAILASLPEDEAKHILQHNEHRYAAFSGYAPDDIKRMIQSYHQQGYVVNTVTPYTIGVGVALYDKDGNLLGAVSVSGIVSKMDKKRQKEIARLIQSEIAHATS